MSTDNISQENKLTTDISKMQLDNNLDDTPNTPNTSMSCAPSTSGLDEETKEDLITLISNDTKEFQINKNYLNISGFLSAAMKDDENETRFKVNVHSKTLKEIIKYMNYHKGVHPEPIKIPLQSLVFKEICKDEFDANFIEDIKQNDLQDLYDITLAANYMSIDSLLHLGSAKIASMIKGKSTAETEEILNPETYRKKENTVENIVVSSNN